MIQRLIENIKKMGAPIVVGLDPMLSYVPEQVQKKAFEEFGETLEGAAEAIWQFNKAIVDAVWDLIPAVKPQVAMYEQFGVPGMAAYEKTVSYCQEKGLVVIGDIKRGDIGSTSEAYAVGHLGKVQVGSRSWSGFHEDFATVNPYLGSDGVKPFLKVCKEEKKGDDYSYVGAVVGATYPEMGKVLRRVMPRSYILVPGYGAQGGKGKDLVHFFNEDGLGAIVNSSRGIIAAYRQEQYASYGAENFAEASRQAVLDMAADIRGALEAAK